MWAFSKLSAERACSQWRLLLAPTLQLTPNFSVDLVCVLDGQGVSWRQEIRGISSTVLSVSILPSFIQPSQRDPVQACDFLVQTQTGFGSPRVIWDAEMPHECSVMGVGDYLEQGMVSGVRMLLV